MENAVNHRMKPDKRSSSESNVDAIMASEPLLIDANTFAAKRTMFATFEILMANVSFFANFSCSSCKYKGMDQSKKILSVFILLI